MLPGEYIFDGPDIELNPGRPVVTLSVNNTGDRPVQIGAHYHFFEVNKALAFDRTKASGIRLALPTATPVRSGPANTKDSSWVPNGGRRVVYGFNALVSARLDDPYTREMSIKRCIDQGYGHKPSDGRKDSR